MIEEERAINIKNKVRILYVTGSHGPIVGYLGNIASGALEKFFKELPINERGPINVVKNMTFWPVRLNGFKRLPPRQALVHSNDIGIKINPEEDALDFALDGFAAQDLDVEELHINTYNKISVIPLKSVLTHLLNTYDLHLKPGDDCPKSYLRENFKYGFKKPEMFGRVFNAEYDHFYDSIDAKYWINYKDIYDYDLLVEHLKNISEMFDIPMEITPEVFEAHDEFMQQLPYGIPSVICNDILQNIKDGNDVDIPAGLTIFHEAWIDAKLELLYNNEIEMPFQNEWFSNTGQIIKHIDQNKKR